MGGITHRMRTARNPAITTRQAVPLDLRSGMGREPRAGRRAPGCLRAGGRTGIIVAVTVGWTGRVSNPLGKLLKGALATEPRPGTALALMGGGHCFDQPARLGARSFAKAPHPCHPLLGVRLNPSIRYQIVTVGKRLNW